MVLMYEAIWHAVIIAPVLLLIGLWELFVTVAHFCSFQIDQMAGEVDGRRTASTVERLEMREQAPTAELN